MNHIQRSIHEGRLVRVDGCSDGELVQLPLDGRSLDRIAVGESAGSSRPSRPSAHRAS